MKRSYLIIAVVVASAGLLATIFLALPSYSSPAMAAPQARQNPFEQLRDGVYAPLYQAQQISCTVSYTTTDALNNVNACPIEEGLAFCDDRAVSLEPSYDGLALIDNVNVPPGQLREVPAHADWFLISSTGTGDEYTVEAYPARGDNYNLGIVVYGPDGTPVASDERPADNYTAAVSFALDSVGAYYVRVYPIPATTCSGRTYSLETTVVEPTPLPSTDEDDYEPNDSFAQAQADDPTLPIQVPILLDLTFHSIADVDYFRFYTKQGQWYEARTTDLSGVDTLIQVYEEDESEIARDDDGGEGLASRVVWQSTADGYDYVVVRNNGASVGSYDLTLDTTGAPATATPGPSPTPRATPRGQADDCEPNPDFEAACVLPLGETLSFNFVPGVGQGPDNDFYKIWVKPGLHYRCKTSDLSPGIDPNMIVFTGPSWDQSIGGNDDIAPCNFNSAFNYYATYSGWLYVLVGTGDRTPSDILDSGYDLTCEKSTTPFVATSTPGPQRTPDPSGKLPTAEPTARQPTPTPTPTRAESPVSTPTPEPQALSVRALTTPTPVPSPAARFVPINLLVYYDADGDREPGLGEGITGISVQAYDATTNELLAQGFTDTDGRLAFTVSSQGPVRISIPFLGFSHLIPARAETEGEASIEVRVPPRSLSGGTP